MKKKCFSLFALILALSAALCGCGSDTPGIETPSYPEETFRPDYEGHSPIPNQRTGLWRQGLIGFPHQFECTSTGVYFLTGHPGGHGSYLFYGDHGSDTIVKLCSRPDCEHNGPDCNAYFGTGASLCYYNNYLYVSTMSELIRIDLDGMNRVTVATTTVTGTAYGGTGQPVLWNGIYCFSKYYPNSGGYEWDTYYYKLDGSTDGAELLPERMGLPLGNDGDNFISYADPVEDLYKSGYAFGLWDPDTKETRFLTDKLGEGYYGAKDAYYIRDGVIYHLNYANGQEEILLNTGLLANTAPEGTEEGMTCFPDCFVVSIRPLSGNSGKIVHTTLYFYNWDYEPLGAVELEYTGSTSTGWHSICGETAERIILADYDRVPRYYIEKSDFGTGHIEMHEYNMPDVDWGAVGG